jgi:hypothetical protein
LRNESVQILIFLLVASCADAQVIVDQEFVAPTNVGYFLDYPGDYMAQTFTVRNSGRLVQLAVQVVNRGGPVQVIDDLYMKLVRTDSAGSPVISDVLSSRTISRFAVPTSDSPVSMIPIDLTSDNLQMHVGDVLAITLSSNNTDANAGDGQYVWKEDFFDRISGGKFFVYSPRIFGPAPFYKWNTANPTITNDAGYRIFIQPVPEPTALNLALVGCIAAMCGHYRRPKSRT